MDDYEDISLNINNAVVQPFTLPEYSGKGIVTNILRLDAIHPVVSGNKWFKLKYYLQEALEQQYSSILTFGGAWSNHIIATAYIARFYGLHAIGIIRGERPLYVSHTLEAARKYGMILEFINRKSYSMKNNDEFRTVVKKKFGRVYFIPEGGAGLHAIKGSEEILSLVDIHRYSHIICCMGTGTMYTGLLNASNPDQQVIGIPVLKGMNWLPRTFTQSRQKSNFCKIINEYHFGGYAKKTAALIQFMNYFYLQTGIPTDFVYTAKLLFACTDLVAKNYFPMGSTILIIHSGGLQGNASLPDGSLIF